MTSLSPERDCGSKRVKVTHALSFFIFLVTSCSAWLYLYCSVALQRAVLQRVHQLVAVFYDFCRSQFSGEVNIASENSMYAYRVASARCHQLPCCAALAVYFRCSASIARDHTIKKMRFAKWGGVGGCAGLGAYRGFSLLCLPVTVVLRSPACNLGPHAQCPALAALLRYKM